jgi:hypothetical protein
VKKKVFYRLFLALVCLLLVLGGCEQEASGSSSASVTVTGIDGDLPEMILRGYEVDLNSYVTVEPENATHKAIRWNIENPEGFGLTAAEADGGVFTPAETGTMKITAVIAGGAGDLPFLKTGYTVSVVDESYFVAATDIAGVPDTGFAGIAIDLGAAKVLPENVTYKTISWSVVSPGSTGASIKGSRLTAASTGTLTLQGVVNNPKTEAYTENFTITINTPLPPPKNWTKAPNIPAQMQGEIQSVCYGNGVFVAGSRDNDGRIAWSSDGVSWTGLDNTTTTLGSNFVHVRFLNGKFWAVGGDGHMACSENGSSWTAVESPGISVNIVDIAYGNGVFVAVGDDGAMSYSENNGDTWTANNQTAYFTDGYGEADFKVICWAGGKFLAAGQFARAIYSADGKIWTDVSAQTGYAVTGKQGKVPCVGKSAGDGISAAAYGGGLYVLAGQGIVGLSHDCVTWERVEMAKFGFPRGSSYGWINSLIYIDGLFVLGGADGESAYSTDGKIWTPIDTNRIFHNFHFINGLAYGGGKLVGVGATCSDPDCSNDPKSTKESDHAGNAGCIAYVAIE